MTVYAYIRVSTKKQTVENQRLQITTDGFTVDEWCLEESVSGSIRALQRPVFSKLLGGSCAGDTIISVYLDRLGRDTEDILCTIRTCKERGVKLRVMELDGVDMTSATGKLLVTLLSAIAELERSKCMERTEAGVARAREEKKVFGRYLKIVPDTLKSIVKDRSNGVVFQKLSEKYSLDKNTICQTLKKWENNLEGYEDIWRKQQDQKIRKAEKLSKTTA